MIFPLKDGTEWELIDGLTDEWRAELLKNNNHLLESKDWDKCISEANLWCIRMEGSNVRKLKTKRGMKSFLLGWIARSDDVRKPVSDKSKQWDSQCGPWLRGASLLELSNSDRFKQMLKVPGFRAWAEKENVLVKEMK